MFLATLLPAVLSAALALPSTMGPSARPDLRAIVELKSRGPADALTDRASAGRTPRPAGVTPIPAVHGEWASGFAVPGLDDIAYCATYFEGQLVVGGRFTHADGQPVNRIARWDGQHWHALGAGFDFDVLSLAVWKGKLVAAGTFAISGSTTTGPLAVWNGTDWASVDPRLQGGIGVLAVRDTELCIGGYFAPMGALWGNRVGQWDGSGIALMGISFDGPVFSLAHYAGGWVAGGNFDHADSAPVHNLARWDGGGWSDMAGGVALEINLPYVVALTSRDTSLVVGGEFSSAGGVPAMGLARWDGHAWSALPGAPADNVIVTSMASDGDVLHIGLWSNSGYAGGSFLGRWDGSTFAFDAGGPDGVPRALAADAGRLATVGEFETVDARPSHAVAVRSGGVWSSPATWQAYRHGLLGGVHAITNFGGGVVAMGEFPYAADDTGWVDVAGVARWDGQHWHPMGQGVGRAFGGALVVHEGVLYQAYSSVKRWNGSSWEIAGSYSPYGVTSLASAGGHLWAGVPTVSVPPASGGTLYRLDGSTWTAIAPPAGLPPDSATVLALANHGGQLVAAWAAGPANGSRPVVICEWSGNGWGPVLGTFVGAYELHLGAFQGNLVAVGDFGSVDGNPIFGFAIRDAAGWSSKGAPLYGYDAFVPTDSLLFVHARDEVQAFDGTRWRSLDTGWTLGDAHAMAVVGNSLWLGGDVRLAGDEPSSGIARYDLSPMGPVVVPPIAWLGLGENPSHESATIHFALAHAGRVHLAIHDLGGRRVRTLVDAASVAGAFTVNWDGRSDDGRAMPSGVYFARLELDGHAAPARKFVRVR